MFPSFELGFTTLPAFFTCLMVAITTAILVPHHEGMKKGVDGNTILDVGLLMMACGLIGARLLHVIADGHFMEYVHLCVDPEQLKGLALNGGRRCVEATQCVEAGLGDLCDPQTGLCRQGRDCLRVFKIWYGGYVFYGGLMLCIPAAIWLIRRRRVPIWTIGDLAGFAIPLGQCIGRPGCFLAGCCFGETTGSVFGIAFPRHTPAWDTHREAGLIGSEALASLPVHPTQLYESIATGLIFATGLWAYRTGRHFRGELFFRYMAAYSLFRIVVEFIRADERGHWIWGLVSTSQLVSMGFLAWGVWVLVRGRAWPAERTGPISGAPAPPKQGSETC